MGKEREQEVNRDIELYIPSELGWERPAADLVASVAKRMAFPPERIDDIKTAVTEAVLNAIEHGNSLDRTRRVLIILTPESDALEINVHDQSATPLTIDADSIAPPSIEDRLAGVTPARGWGTFLIRTLVDEVEFSYTGEGNVVRMVIHLGT